MPAIAVHEFVILFFHRLARLDLHTHGGVVDDEDVDAVDVVRGEELAAAILLMLAT